MSRFVAVIMAGGKGQRFWPLSTAQKPKQFLDLNRCGRTLIQTTFDRLIPLTGGPEYILVATAADYVPLVREQLPEIPEENLLVEPVGRDSAPAVAAGLARTAPPLRRRHRRLLLVRPPHRPARGVPPVDPRRHRAGPS